MEMSFKKKLVLFLLLNGFYFFAYFHRVAIPGTIFDQLQLDFNLTATRVASLGTIVLSIYGILQFFIGPCMDYFGTNRIFIAGGFLLCVGSLLFSISHSIFLLFFSRILVGFGASVAYLGIVKKTDELFGHDLFPVMLGLGLFLGYSGGLFATLPFERLVCAFGWRNTIFYLTVILLFVVTVILTQFATQHQLGHQKNSVSFLDIKNVLLNKKSYPLIISVSINFTIYFLFQGILGKKILQDTSGISSKIAASFTFSMMAIIMIFVLIWGVLTRFVKNKKRLVVHLCLISMLSCVLMLLNLVFWKTPAVFFLVFSLFAIVAGSGPLTTTLIKEINPSFVGTSVGFINGICYISVAISGNIAGFIMDSFRSKAVITSSAVIYPVVSYILVSCFCLFLSLISLIASLKISETQKDVAIEVPAIP